MYFHANGGKVCSILLRDWKKSKEIYNLTINQEFFRKGPSKWGYEVLFPKYQTMGKTQKLELKKII